MSLATTEQKPKQSESKLDKRLNIISASGASAFGRLVHESFKHHGYDVKLWDYRRNRFPFDTLDRDAPSLVLKGEDLKNIAPVLDWMTGPRYLWYAEDITRDNGMELMSLACYFDELWLHWIPDDARQTIGKTFSHKRLTAVPTLYADLNIWKPLWPHEARAYHFEALHYGYPTPRREALMAELRDYQADEYGGYVITQVYDMNQARINRMINRSRVCLNLHAWAGINLETRMAELMAAGAVIITEKLPDQELVHPIEGDITKNEDIMYYVTEPGDTERMIDIIKDASTGPLSKDLQHISNNAHEFAVKFFDHKRIARDVERLIDWRD